MKKIFAGHKVFISTERAKHWGGNLVKHWNMLVEMCETDYCIMSSDDDVYSPTFLEEINNLTEKYPDVCL